MMVLTLLCKLIICTDIFSTTAVVKQKDPLISRLFNIYINGFPLLCLYMMVKPFMLMVYHSMSIIYYLLIIGIIAISEIMLQIILNRAYQWSKDWGIIFYLKKCSITHHRTKSIYVTQFSFSLDAHYTVTVDTFKYRCIVKYIGSQSGKTVNQLTRSVNHNFLPMQKINKTVNMFVLYITRMFCMFSCSLAPCVA